MKKVLKKMIPIICLIPFMIGTIGYLLSGEMITDSLYASFALYFTNPVSDAYNRCIEFARWTAPLVMVTAILCVLRNVWDNLRWRISLFCKNDSVAVYSDEDVRIKFDKGTKAIYPGEIFKGYAKSHIIMFSSDQKSLQFFEEHKEQFKKKAVYIGLKDLELGLVREVKDVTLFDINGSIARLLWKNISLWKSHKEKMNVVIYGSSSLAQEVLSAGLQLNLFSLKQQIKYHVLSENCHFQIKHQGMQLMNSDEIDYYRADEKQAWKAISKADIVIIADRIPLDLLQTIAVKAHSSIYYYSPEEGDAAAYISFGNFKPFGRNAEVFTDKNIRRQGLIEKAIVLNERYANRYHTEGAWNNLSGFLKASNISSADYGEVAAVLSKNMSDEALAELEHIRWCRFHYLNYWRYGVPEKGGNKDEEKRIHKDLVAYAQLDEEEKAKNAAAIRTSK